jgi:hypothetical protein
LPALDNPRDSHPILGLVNYAATELPTESRHTDNEPTWPKTAEPQTAPQASHDLIDALQRQYWRALFDPHDILMGSRAWHDSELSSPMIEAAEQGWQAPQESSQHDSIDGWLSIHRTLEDMFGDLTPHGETAEISAIPEVLRLFAPVDFLAAEAHRRPPSLPALNRREHHTLSVDSAYVAPALIVHTASEPLV